MRAIHWDLHGGLGIDRIAAGFSRLSHAREIEIGLGGIIWLGLVFVIVHFGGLTAA